ncbi:Fe-Mn family superoxide dismutase [Acidovorax sp. LjRoot38]|nr:MULTISPECIES: Fe-Mn family superoxide dismutase [Acidovorax]MCO4244117.1 Fe-Mn family superoxide dismutase [Acidovorax facilis]
MYEHAYQLDFGAKAGAYVDAYMAKSSGTRSTSAKALLSRRMRWHLASTQALRWPVRQVRLTCDLRRTICRARRSLPECPRAIRRACWSGARNWTPRNLCGCIACAARTLAALRSWRCGHAA